MLDVLGELLIICNFPVCILFVFRLDELENSGIDIEAEELICKQAIAKVREKEHELYVCILGNRCSIIVCSA